MPMIKNEKLAAIDEMIWKGKMKPEDIPTAAATILEALGDALEVLESFAAYAKYDRLNLAFEEIGLGGEMVQSALADIEEGDLL